MKFLVLALLFFTLLGANEIVDDEAIEFQTQENFEIVESQEEEQEEILEVVEEEEPQITSSTKVLYLSFKEIPKRVLKGEIFSITIKALSIVKNPTDITYSISNHAGLKLLNDFPEREIDSKYYYDTFYFLVTHNNARTPTFKATMHDYNDNIYKPTTIVGKKLNIITLNPKDNFCNIIANSFDLVQYKTSHYDKKHNIVILVATATNSDIKAMKFQNTFKQGIESATESYFESRIIYFNIIDKKIENFSFSYFNLKKNGFEVLNIPIVVNDNLTTTQSNLKPKDLSKERLKMLIAGAIALLSFIFILWRKKYIYLIFIIIPLAYIAYIAIPSKEVCIKVGSNIYLLPVNNGTIFEKTTTRYYLQKEGSAKKFVKVKLQNNKIGWVKNEDLCLP